MELVNATKMQVGYTLGLDPDGRERVVVVVKGTFAFPEHGGIPRLAETQLLPVMSDEFFGEPGLSAMRYESDYAPEKPRCDVLLNGGAWAPRGKPAERVSVALSVGNVTKSFAVVGKRVWDSVLGFSKATDPEPFLSQPIHYGCAYGGVQTHPEKEAETKTYGQNPVGTGYYPFSRGKALLGKPLPSTEESNQAVRSQKDDYAPMAFGPMGRQFAARYPFAGTFDQNWIDNVCPFLPADFDKLYYQSAPADQQIDYPKGGERVVLSNLTPEGDTRFELPKIEIPVEFTNAAYERKELRAALDTLILEPDEKRFLLVWRASCPLQRNLLEMRQCVIGHMSRGWKRARDLGKTYHPSLAHVVASRAREED